MTKKRLFIISSVLLMSFMMIFAGCKKDDDSESENEVVNSKSWIKKATFAGSARSGAFTFSLNGKGYIGGGSIYYEKSSTYIDEIKADMIKIRKDKENGIRTANYLNDLWEYDESSNSWTQKADVPSTTFINPAFSINGIGYIVGYTKFHEYNSITNTWTSQVPNNYVSEFYDLGFSANSKGYFGTTDDSKDFYEYNPATNTCKKIPDFPGEERNGIFSFSFSADNKGYVGGGGDVLNDLYDTWEYDPSSSVWRQKADCLIPTSGGGFHIDNCGYVVSSDGACEYNASSNTWTMKESYPYGYIYEDISFTIGNNAYILLYGKTDFYQFKPL